MSDPRLIAWMKRIDTKLDGLKAERAADLAEIDVELDAHEQHLARHDDEIAALTRRLGRAEKKLNGGGR